MFLSGLLNQAPKLKHLVMDNSTTILTGAGVVGTVGTAYLTGRATFRAAEIIQKQENPNTPEGYVRHSVNSGEMSKMDKVKLVWPHYIPPGVVLVITVTSIVAANRISSKKIAALVVASGISDRALTEYKQKVIEKFGERKETDIRDEIAQDKVNKNPPDSRQVIIAGSGQVLCFDTLTGRYFHSTVEDIRRAENRVNYEIIHFNSASLSMFYEEIGLDPTDYTDSVGWNSNGPLEVKLSTVMSTDNRPCVAIGFTRNPTPDYDNNWT